MIDALTATDHLVGNLYFNNGVLPIVAGRLHPDDVPNGLGKTVYREMCRLYMDPEQELSAGALEGALRSVNFDFGYLSDLQGRIMPESVESLEEYADAINNAADLSTLRATVSELMESSQDSEAVAEKLIPELMQRLSFINRSNTNTLQPIGDVMDELIADIMDWQQGKTSSGLDSGFIDIDKIFKLEPGELTLVAARPSMGKTAYALQVAENVAEGLDDGVVVVFSAEMTSKSLGMRMISAKSGVNAHRLRNRTAGADEYDSAIKAARSFADTGLIIDQTSAITTEQMYYRTAMLNAQTPVKLVIFDFVELGGDSTGGRGSNEEQRISKIAQGLKNIAKNLNVPVMALSQLSREVDKRTDKIPILADLRYSGMLEQVSDVVLFLMRPEYYIKRNQACYLDETAGNPSARDDHPHAENVAYGFVAKNRNGPIGKANLSFIPKYTRFGNLVRV